MSAETVARLHIVLNDIEPAIWRRVDVPVTASLKMLHDVVQAAMGWENSHLWHFEAGDRRYGLPDPMWPESGMAAAKNVKLTALIDRGVRELVYTYEMGDDWRHTITVETVGPGEPDVKYPRFVARRAALPAEDVGGLPASSCSWTPWPTLPTRNMSACATGMAARTTPMTSMNASPDAPLPPSPSAAMPGSSPTRRAARNSKAAYRPRLPANSER